LITDVFGAGIVVIGTLSIGTALPGLAGAPTAEGSRGTFRSIALTPALAASCITMGAWILAFLAVFTAECLAAALGTAAVKTLPAFAVVL